MAPLSRLTTTAVLTWVACSSPGSATEVFQWTDEAGVVHFSDTRPADAIAVNTLIVSESNPPDYDPADDPYSIRNQAGRMSEAWSRLELAREEREEKRRQDAERNPRFDTRPYDEYRYYSRPPYFVPGYPGRPPARPNGSARRQAYALDELGLSGPRPHSINSGGHRERVAASQALPTVSPPPGPGPRPMPR